MGLAASVVHTNSAVVAARHSPVERHKPPRLRTPQGCMSIVAAAVFVVGDSSVFHAHTLDRPDRHHTYLKTAKQHWRHSPRAAVGRMETAAAYLGLASRQKLRRPLPQTENCRSEEDVGAVKMGKADRCHRRLWRRQGRLGRVEYCIAGAESLGCGNPGHRSVVPRGPETCYNFQAVPQGVYVYQDVGPDLGYSSRFVSFWCSEFRRG